MSNTPSDAEIDEVTLDVLGYAALDKETNDTAVLIYLEGYTELKKLIQIFLNKKN